MWYQISSRASPYDTTNTSYVRFHARLTFQRSKISHPFTTSTTMMHGHTSKGSTMQNHLIYIQQQYKG